MLKLWWKSLEKALKIIKEAQSRVFGLWTTRSSGAAGHVALYPIPMGFTSRVSYVGLCSVVRGAAFNGTGCKE